MTTNDNLTSGALRVGSHDRTFTLHKPRRAEASEVPLVIVLHGHGEGASGAMMREWTSFDAHADEWGIAVAYPDGYRCGWADGRGVTAADADDIDATAEIIRFALPALDAPARLRGVARQPGQVT